MRFEPQVGTAFYDAINQCKTKMEEGGHAYATMVFNELEVTVYPDSNPNDTAKIYDLMNEMRRRETK